MNIQCITPPVHIAGKWVQFHLPARDAIAWYGLDSTLSDDAMISWLLASPEALLWGIANQAGKEEFEWSNLLECNDLANEPVVTPELVKLKIQQRKLLAETLATCLGKQAFSKARQWLASAYVDCCDISLTQIKAWMKTIPLAKHHWARLEALDPVPRVVIAVSKKATDNGFAEKLHQEKMASMKQLAYGASHEINNPLANIASRAQTLLMDEKDPGKRRRLAKINEQAFRAHEMIADMMLFAHPPQPDFTPVNPVQLVSDVVEEMQGAAEEQQTVIQFSSQSVPELLADKTQLAVAVKALLQNSLEAIRESGTVQVEVRQVTEEPLPLLEITIVDDGPGIDPDVRQHIFDPFYSGREAGRGLGFGLSKAWRIAELHNGEIFAESDTHAGARFCLRIPYRVAA